MNSIIFLDIDGVLVTRQTLKERTGVRSIANKDCVTALNYLIDNTGAKIVLASSWRFCGLEEMRLILKHWGVTGHLIDMTPDLTVRKLTKIYSSRGQEIQAWIDRNRFSLPFVILDDRDDMEQLEPFLVRTKSEEGFLMVHAEIALSKLKKKKNMELSKTECS